MAFKLNRPIFIVGTGRCGSTILNKLLTEHPNLAFLTTASVVFPSSTKIQQFILRMWHNPVFGPLLRLRIIAGEAWPFWDQYIAGFSESYRDFRATDVTNKQIQLLRNNIPTLLSKKRHRLLFKFTGWTRIGFIKKVFPDAKIIHITRDPRAVINSMLHINFWNGRLGPYRLNWGGLTPEELDIWNRYDQSFITLAAIEYKRIISAYHESLQSLDRDAKNDIYDLSYHALCKNHCLEMGKVLTFCCLEEHPAFLKKLSTYTLKSQNDKWKSDLTQQQQQELEAVIQELDLNHFDNF